MNDELMTNPFGICTDKLTSVEPFRLYDSNCISLDYNSFLSSSNDYALSEVVKNAVKEAIQENNMLVAPEIEKYHIKHK